jgi:hypothetical protein
MLRNNIQSADSAEDTDSRELRINIQEVQQQTDSEEDTNSEELHVVDVQQS